MEITANALQTVEVNQNVLFTDTAVAGNCSIMHREGSGLVILRGLTNNQSRARFKVTFGGNIAVPTGGEEGAISLALALDGESIATSTMTVTPADVAQFFNVSKTINIDVPKGCCFTLAVENVSSQSIDVQNANLVVERVA